MKKGDIFKINLSDGKVAYAQALVSPEFAFFEESPIDTITEPLFRLWVHKGAVKEWAKVGNQTLSPEFEEPVPRYKQDPINKRLYLYKNGTETPATLDEIKGLECAAVWEGNHIVDRLSDYFAGRENIWLKSLQPKING